MTEKNKTTAVTTYSPLFTLLVFVSLALVFAVIALSAYLRLTATGLGCADWPACYAHIEPPGATADMLTTHLVPPWATLIHRLTATALGVSVLGIAVIALRHRRQPGQAVLIPLLILGLTLFLSILGYKTPSPLTPWITLSNLLGGMLMAALLWWLGQRSVTRVTPDREVQRLRPWALAGLVVIVMQIALGGWVSANFAAPACTTLAGCGNFPWLDGPWRESLNLFRVLPITDGGVIITGDVAKVIHMTHRVGAAITSLYIGWLGWRAFSLGNRSRSAGITILVFLLLQLALGISAVVFSLPVTVVTGHNAGAALLLLSVVNLIHHLTPPTGQR